jgi:hypothetical protein
MLRTMRNRIIQNFNPLRIISKDKSINVVCCSCKKVISGPKIAHETSHGLCPDCAKTLYPDVFPELDFGIYEKY